ncbi:carboxylesterase/lipase family protein [Alicyclobacillus acidiphilus]|jgi:para-nitrobenzyl esterase|uniref:carboxylesterase/lipase family protein n=1 Tax=Alicyclobacillus acidiphilus TaxID=182455 RepID=UPI00083346F1|nr:carboxylesterase/lipase family protein [Alicyclobacillus acidiphilus]
MATTISPVVETRYGKVQGVQQGSIFVWRGIPYAKPPIGPLRFQPPEPPEPWDDIRDTTQFRGVCPQPPNTFYETESLTLSEDCLYLNIWSPKPDGGRRPVMVWIHGGAYHSGSGQQRIYDGTSFAANDVVLVTINYRLGPFGFLYLADHVGPNYQQSGNCGILDQVAALAWVRDNIEAFGGDPNRVTVFGESAGAMSIGTLMTMPQARGLFQQAILESGLPLGGLQACDAATAAARTREILHNLGLEDGNIQALLDAPAEALVQASQSISQSPMMRWRPMVDGVSIKQTLLESLTSGSIHSVPTLIGCNLNELTLWTANDDRWRNMPDDHALIQAFEHLWGPIAPELRAFYVEGASGLALVDRLTQLGSYAVFALPIQILAAYQAERHPMWVYRFDWQSTAAGGIYKAAHAMELPFVFNTISDPAIEQLTGSSPDRARLANEMHQSWIAFAHRGNPNHAAIPEWPRYNMTERPTMVFDTQTRLENDPYGKEREVWERVLQHR